MSDTVQWVEFFGERFAVPARMNARLRVRFMRLAAEGADTAEAESEAAILLDKMVQSSVRPEDQDRFDALCERECPSDEDLMRFIVNVIAAAAERPTGQPSDSSAGLTVTEPKSVSVPASSVQPDLQLVRELEQQGRADKAEFVMMNLRARSAV